MEIANAVAGEAPSKPEAGSLGTKRSLPVRFDKFEIIGADYVDSNLHDEFCAHAFNVRRSLFA